MAFCREYLAFSPFLCSLFRFLLKKILFRSMFRGADQPEYVGETTDDEEEGEGVDREDADRPVQLRLGPRLEQTSKQRKSLSATVRTLSSLIFVTDVMRAEKKMGERRKKSFRFFFIVWFLTISTKQTASMVEPI